MKYKYCFCCVSFFRSFVIPIIPISIIHDVHATRKNLEGWSNLPFSFVYLDVVFFSYEMKN